VIWFREMKIFAFVFGIGIALYSGIKLVQILFSTHSLTEYGKGYVTGNIILFLIGSFIVYSNTKRKNENSN